MKRICIILDKPNKGGVGSVTNALSAALADKYEIHILYLYSEEPLPKSPDERIKTSVLLNKYYNLRKLRKLSKPLLKKYITENKINLAILQTYYDGFAASTLRYTTNVKLIFCEHCSVIHFKDTQANDILCEFISSLFCHKVVTLTEATRNEYIKKFHLPAKKVTTIYNWLDFSIPHSDEYNVETKQIISAGRIAPEKRFDYLIKAFAIVNKKFPDWQLHIYGDGELISETKELIKNLDLSENVNLPGMVSNLH